LCLVHCISVPSSTVQSLLKHGGSVIFITTLMSDREETTSTNASTVATPTTATNAMASNISPVQGIHPPCPLDVKGNGPGGGQTGRPSTKRGKTTQ